MTMGARRAALAVAAVLAAGAVTVLDTAAPRMPPGEDPDSAARAAGPPGRAMPAERGLRLVGGSGLVNGIYTSYPRSLAGAVSAAVEFMTELGSTLDPDRAATVVRLVADPSYRSAPQDAAAGVLAARARFGLAASGPVPPGTAAYLVPVMYELRDVGAGQLTVLLLFDYTLTAPSGIRELLGVTAVRLTWTSAGWRLLRPAASDLGVLLATPGTAAAAAKGWEVMSGAM
jgi:hypothetical protein